MITIIAKANDDEDDNNINGTNNNNKNNIRIFDSIYY